MLEFDSELQENGCLFSHENCFPCNQTYLNTSLKYVFGTTLGSRDTACNVLVSLCAETV